MTAASPLGGLDAGHLETPLMGLGRLSFKSQPNLQKAYAVQQEVRRHLKPEHCGVLLTVIMLITIISNAVRVALKPRWPNKNHQHSRANCILVTR